MTTKEMVISVLMDHDCLTGFQMKGFVYRKFGENITPQSATGILRPLIAKGYATGSPGADGKMVYWLTDIGKQVLAC